MGLNKTTKKKIQPQQRIPQKELELVNELRAENTNLKKEIKALQKFIKRIKSSKNVTAKLETSKKQRSKDSFCPSCDGMLKDIKMNRSDGIFSISSCVLCSYRSPMTKVE